MRYYLAIFTTIVFFSTIEVVTRHVHNVAPDLDSNLVAFIRFFPAGILMLVLGHRRLSIIDLRPEGNQPMLNEDGTVTLHPLVQP